MRKEQLSERTHACAECRHTEPRDVASARIVYAWLRKQLQARDTGQELPHGRAQSASEAVTKAPQAFGTIALEPSIAADVCVTRRFQGPGVDGPQEADAVRSMRRCMRRAGKPSGNQPSE